MTRWPQRLRTSLTGKARSSVRSIYVGLRSGEQSTNGDMGEAWRFGAAGPSRSLATASATRRSRLPGGAAAHA